MALVICASFVGMAHAKLEAASASPSLLVVSLIRGASTTSVTLSTNTISTVLEDAIGTSGTDSQLVGVVEINITKPAATGSALQLGQLLQDPSTAPEVNHFAAFGASGTWTALEVFSNLTPADGSLRTSAILNVNSPSGISSANILEGSGNIYTGLIGILSFYAVDDAGNSTADGTFTATFTIGFSV